MAAAPPKAKNAASTTEVDTGSKKKKKLFLIIGIVVALVVISIGGTVVALKMLAPAAESDKSASAEEGDVETVLAPAIYFEMTPNFTINFNVNGRQRYLQVAITLMHRNPELDALLKLHMPAIRNGLVMLLSAKKFEELQTQEGKELLRAEALEIVRAQLQKEQEALVTSGKADEVSAANIEQLLFTNFVMQ